MRQKPVYVHTKTGDHTAVHIEDKTYQAVPAAIRAAAQPIHLLYNGQDHYNGFVERTNSAGLIPAWPQPSPAIYVDPYPAAASPVPYKLESPVDFPHLGITIMPGRKGN